MSIRLENISKTYEAPQKKLEVLKNINLEIKDKQAMAIFGPSGIGKTTLLNLIGGMLQPTSGKIIIDGVDISSLKSDRLAQFRKEKIGFVFQEFNLLPNLKAIDNISLPILLDKDFYKKISLIHEFAAQIGMKDRLSHRPGELSSGEQQRAAIMRAIVNSPSIILADEPTADLDEENSKKIIDILKELNQKRGCTVIVATNDRQTASQFTTQFNM